MLQAWRVADDVRQACRHDGQRRAALASLRQGQQDVLHQHGADHHFLAVDRQLRRPFLFGHHGDQHQAAAGHRPAGEPVDRMVGRRNRRTEIKAAQIESEGRATEIEEETTALSVSRFHGANLKHQQDGEQVHSSAKKKKLFSRSVRLLIWGWERKCFYYSLILFSNPQPISFILLWWNQEVTSCSWKPTRKTKKNRREATESETNRIGVLECDRQCVHLITIKALPPFSKSFVWALHKMDKLDKSKRFRKCSIWCTRILTLFKQHEPSLCLLCTVVKKIK